MTSRLLCVGFATSLDRYAWLGTLRPGGVNRPTEVVELAGGKAFNVARSAVRLELDVHTVALVGGPSGAAVQTLAQDEGLSTTFVTGAGDTRQCLCLLDGASGEVTEVYEPMRTGDVGDVEAMCLAVEHHLRELAADDLLVLSGRLAPCHDEDSLGRLVAAARRGGVPVVVDSDGAALSHALRAGPDLVKVNRTEAARVTELAADAEAVTLASALHSLGATAAVVTDGAGGAVAVRGSECWVLAPEPILGASPVGSGDAFLAGVAAGAFGRDGIGGPLRHLLLDGVAAARVNARSFMAGSVDPMSWREERAALSRPLRPHRRTQ